MLLLCNQEAENSNILIIDWHIFLSSAGKAAAQRSEGLSSQLHQVQAGNTFDLLLPVRSMFIV